MNFDNLRKMAAYVDREYVTFNEEF